MIKFSVVIPLYNKGEKISRTLELVLKQDYNEYEIVVVDDGSNDNSSHFVKKISDKRISYYYKPNGGVSSARNYGIERARYDWIVFLDADDDLQENALSLFRNLIEKYPKTNIYATRQSSQYRSKGLVSKFFYSLFHDYCTNSPFFMYWIRILFASPGTLCFNKKLYNNSIKFDERHSYYEDLEFLLKLFRGNSVVVCNECTFHYNQDDSGLSRGYHSVDKEMMYHVTEWIESCGFWEKAILYENLEETKCNWLDDENNLNYYTNLQDQYFSSTFKRLHCIRQRLIKYGIL